MLSPFDCCRDTQHCKESRGPKHHSKGFVCKRDRYSKYNNASFKESNKNPLLADRHDADLVQLTPGNSVLTDDASVLVL